MFDAARETNSNATLLINDFDVSSAYDILVEGCLEAGIQFDVIGIQSHMHQGWWGVENTFWSISPGSTCQFILRRRHCLRHLMPPEIVDLNDYQVEEWPTTSEGEERQAQEAILHYQTLFAHPLVEGITWWDMSDGGWLNAPAGLLRKNGSSKPAYDELLKLVKGEWWISLLAFYG
jgi:GH35 family endo-1,4-beta-xylanase